MVAGFTTHQNSCHGLADLAGAPKLPLFLLKLSGGLLARSGKVLKVDVCLSS
jgi:hypothetical protein